MAVKMSVLVLRVVTSYGLLRKNIMPLYSTVLKYWRWSLRILYSPFVFTKGFPSNKFLSLFNLFRRWVTTVTGISQ